MGFMTDDDGNREIIGNFIKRFAPRVLLNSDSCELWVASLKNINNNGHNKLCSYKK